MINKLNFTKLSISNNYYNNGNRTYNANDSSRRNDWRNDKTCYGYDGVQFIENRPAYIFVNDPIGSFIAVPHQGN